MDRMKQILNDVLETDFIKKMRKERDVKDEIDFYGVQGRKTEFELEILGEFFAEVAEEILKVKSIWLWIEEQVKDELAEILADQKTFLEKGIDFEMRDYVDGKLDELADKLDKLYRKRLDDEWKGLLWEQAKEKLPKGQQYVALLDQDGYLTREPYPITRDMNVKLTWKFDTDEYGRRNIIVTGDRPLKKGETYTSEAIRLRDNEVNATIIKT